MKLEIVSKLPEVTLKAHDQSIVAFTMDTLYLESAVNISNTRISPSVSRVCLLPECPLSIGGFTMAMKCNTSSVLAKDCCEYDSLT